MSAPTCGFYLGCGGRPDDPQHHRPWSGGPGTMHAHDFDPSPTLAAARAESEGLRAALEGLVERWEQVQRDYGDAGARLDQMLVACCLSELRAALNEGGWGAPWPAERSGK